MAQTHLKAFVIAIDAAIQKQTQEVHTSAFQPTQTARGEKKKQTVQKITEH